VFPLALRNIAVYYASLKLESSAASFQKIVLNRLEVIMSLERSLLTRKRHSLFSYALYLFLAL